MDETTSDALPEVKVARRFGLLTLIPFAGLLMFGAGAALALRAFSHNNSLDCQPLACTHYSYALPIALGIGGLVVLMGGGALLSYFTVRHVGVPIVAAIRNRGRD